MYNSLKVFLLSVFITTITLAFLTNTIEYTILLDKSLYKLKSWQIDSDKINREWTEEELTDISSRININFFDFTLFKNPPLNSLLKPEYSWTDLDTFRLERGFVMNLDLYREFFLDDIDYNKIFTLYNTPNINNISDSMAELLYLEITEHEEKAAAFKRYLQQRRREKKLLTERDLKQLEARFSKEVLERLTTVPTWNRNEVPTILKQAISSYSREVQETWLGDETSFYQVELINEDRVKMTLIYNRERLFSIIRGDE